MRLLHGADEAAPYGQIEGGGCEEVGCCEANAASMASLLQSPNAEAANAPNENISAIVGEFGILFFSAKQTQICFLKVSSWTEGRS